MAAHRVGLALALACIAIAGCSSGEEPDVLTVTPMAANLETGDTLRIVAELRTGEGQPVPGATYTWTSSATAVASVSTTGLVTANIAGTATITVTSAGLSKEVSIGVASGATSIVVAPSTVTLVQGGVENLVVGVYNENGEPMPGAPVTFAASGGIATVTPQGVVTATGAGQGFITVSSGAASLDVPLVFTGHPAGVRGPRLDLGARPFGIAVGQDSSLLVTQLDADRVARGRTSPAGFNGSIVVGSIPTSVVIAPPGDTAFVANQASGSVGLVRVSAGVQSTAVTVPGDPFRVLLAYGTLIFVSTNIDSVFIINRATQAIVWRAGVGLDPNGMALSPGGLTLYVTNVNSGSLSEVDIATAAVSRTFTLGGTPQDVVISPDGTELYVANEASLLQVVELATGNITSAGAGTGNLFGLALSPDGKVLVGTRPGSGQVVLIDRVSREVISTVSTGGKPRRVAFDLLGSIAAVANEAGWVDLIR